MGALQPPARARGVEHNRSARALQGLAGSRWWHRSRYLRAFRSWLWTSREHLSVRLIHHRSRKRSIDYRLAGYGGRIVLSVMTSEIVLSVMREGEVWDLLFSSELVVRKTSQGFGCALCEPSVGRFLRRDALWRAHDFEPFGVWLDTHLGGRPGVEFHRRDGATWVRLVRNSAGDRSATLVESLSFDDDSLESEPCSRTNTSR